MAQTLRVILLFLHTFVYRVWCFSLDCTNNMHACENTNIQCMDDEDCYIACNEEQSCMHSTITCPAHADCTIECDGWQACKDTIIDATYSTSGNLNILCQGSTDHCSGIQILGSIVYNNDGNMNLLCNGELRSCMGSHVRCPVSGNCLISCNADKSCQYANVTGPIHGDLTVDCNEDSSCFGSVLDGHDAHQMDVSGCTAPESCFGMTLKCPPNTNQTAKCFIQGNDNIGSGTTLYALNGWKDVQMAYSGQYGTSHGGNMFCGTDYNANCEISSSEWSCAEDSHYCNNIGDINVENGLWNTGATIPPLAEELSESMGMVLIVGGLIALAVGCILVGVIKHFCSKYLEMQLKRKGYQDPQRVKPVKAKHRIEAIIDGDEPSYVDSKGNAHHQHPQHERKLSSLHDKF